jgi:hypothetical protein
MTLTKVTIIFTSICRTPMLRFMYSIGGNMSKPYVVEVKALILIDADTPDSAADIVNLQLEDISFDFDILSVNPW